MATFITNNAFNNSRVHLNDTGQVVGNPPANVNNQKWIFPAGLLPLFVEVQGTAGAVVGVAAADVPLEPPEGFVYNAPLIIGGAVNNFQIQIIGGCVQICLPAAGGRPQLFWTLAAPISQVTLRAMGGPNQHWDIASA